MKYPILFHPLVVVPAVTALMCTLGAAWHAGVTVIGTGNWTAAAFAALVSLGLSAYAYIMGFTHARSERTDAEHKARLAMLDDIQAQLTALPGDPVPNDAVKLREHLLHIVGAWQMCDPDDPGETFGELADAVDAADQSLTAGVPCTLPSTSDAPPSGST